MITRLVLLLLALGSIATAVVLAALPDLRTLPELRAEPVSGAARPATVLRVGSIAPCAREETRRFRPFTEALRERLPQVGRVDVAVLPDVSAMADALARGAIDLYVDSPLPVAQVHRITTIHPIAVRHKRGQREYASVVFVRDDSEVRSLADLAGARIAFTEPFSSAGFMLPAMLLAESGLQLRELPPEALPTPREVGYCFSRDDETSLVWVLYGRAAAAAMGETEFTHLVGTHREELRVVATSTPLPRQIVCVRADLDPALESALTDVLLQLASDPAAASMLREFEGTSGFSRLQPGEFERACAVLTRFEEAVGR